MNKDTELFIPIGTLVALLVICPLCIAATWNWAADNLWDVPKIGWFQALVALLAIRSLISPRLSHSK